MMNLEKRLEIGGEGYPLQTEQVTLQLNGVGAGVFTVVAAAAPELGAFARFVAGWRGQEHGDPVALLAGPVTEAQATAPGLWRVVAKEMAIMLEEPNSNYARLSLVHPTAADVLAAITEATGLDFLVPGTAEYLNLRLPHYCTAGSYREALEGMGPAWGVPRCVWAPLPDGRIFWGDWRAGPWEAEEPFTINQALIQEWDPEARALVAPWLPRLRPGLTITAGNFTFLLWKVTFHGDKARLQWREVEE